MSRRMIVAAILGLAVFVAAAALVLAQLGGSDGGESHSAPSATSSPGPQPPGAIDEPALGAPVADDPADDEPVDDEPTADEPAPSATGEAPPDAGRTPPPSSPPAPEPSPTSEPNRVPLIAVSTDRIDLTEDNGLGSGPVTVDVAGFIAALSPGLGEPGQSVTAHVAVKPGDGTAPDVALRLGDAASGVLFSGEVELVGNALRLPLAADRSGRAVLEVWATDSEGLDSARLEITVVVAPDFDQVVVAVGSAMEAVENAPCVVLDLSQGTSTYGDLVPALYGIDAIDAQGGALLHDGAPVAAGFATFDPQFCFIPAPDDVSAGNDIDGWDPYAVIDYTVHARYQVEWAPDWSVLSAQPDPADPERAARQAVVTVFPNQAPTLTLSTASIALQEDHGGTGVVEIPGFVAAADPGAPREAGQAVHFEIELDEGAPHSSLAFYRGRVPMAGADLLAAASVEADGTLSLGLRHDAWARQASPSTPWMSRVLALRGPT